MDLYIIRHAEALPIGAGIETDEDRPLTEHGQAQAQRLGEVLSARGVFVELLLTSPLLRARQTAEGILSSWQGEAPALRECPQLAPDSKKRALAMTINEMRPHSVALVGHQPDLARYAAWFIGSAKALVDFDKAGAAYIHSGAEIRKGCGTLIWLITSDWLLPPGSQM